MSIMINTYFKEMSSRPISVCTCRMLVVVLVQSSVLQIALKMTGIVHHFGVGLYKPSKAFQILSSKPITEELIITKPILSLQGSTKMETEISSCLPSVSLGEPRISQADKWNISQRPHLPLKRIAQHETTFAVKA